MTAPDLVIQRRFSASPEALFNAWLSADALARFMCPAPGVTIAEATCDARVGGAFRVVMQVGDRRMPHRGEYRVIEPHTRLAFTWRSATAGDDSVVTLAFRPVDDQTELTLTHVNLPSASARAAHEGGWTHILETLSRNPT